MSDYDRPNLPWLCGHADGPCSAGPNGRGGCPALGECVPIRSGARWVCNRGTGRGGPCDEGPTPEGACCRVKRCRPRRSLRSIRGRWVRGAALFTAGALLMLVGAKSRNELAVPGELSSHHAQVIARSVWSNRCASCHPGANSDAASWAAAAIQGAHEGVTQSDLCLDCHRDLAGPRAEPLLAHGLPEGALETAARTLIRQARFLGPPGVGLPALGTSHDDPLACAACHQEHHGAEHDLAAMTDARCQACHTQRYASFADDHPDFGLWPTSRRTRIAFNHASHAGDHFAKANRDFDCRACHHEDATGDLTVRPTYQDACAECHDGDLLGSFGDGIAFLSLPTLDREAIASAGEELRVWPLQAEGDFDGELPIYTKLLLASDPAAAESMRRLGEDFSFFDIDEEARVADAATLAQAITRLLDEIQEEGHAAIAYRLGRLVGEAAAPEGDYVGRLPIELIDRVQATWLGGKQPPEPYDAIEDRTTGGGWSIDDDRLTLRYRPTGHDDPLARAWIDAVIALPDEHRGLREAALDELTRPGAPGQCLECHSLETSEDELVVNWNGRDRLEEPRGFTKFSHRPHLVQPELADCSHCHALKAPAGPASVYSGFDPTRFNSEFTTLSKAACVQCHQPHAAGDSCTQCHNYHIEPAAIRAP